MNYEIHPAADIFPMMDDKRFKELTEDIKVNGQREPIKILSGKILDGRNRYAACQAAGVTPQFTTMPEDLDPWLYVWSLNGERRDLSNDQRYLLWKECSEKSDAWQKYREDMQELANQKRSMAAERQHEVSNPRRGETMVAAQPVQLPKANRDIARQAKAAASNTNRGTVERMDRLVRERPELADKVKSGELPAATAMREMQREVILAKVQQKTEILQANPLPTSKFELVLADPPWRYDFAETDNRKIENQYPTATVEEICEHKPDTGNDCVLFLWGTVAKLVEAMQVMAAWGFTYKTHAVWDKEMIGMGYWFRGQHELLLVGTKGKASPPLPEHRVSSIFQEPRSRHSKKPECVYEWIERAFPERSKLEMYCRYPRAGWAVSGYES